MSGALRIGVLGVGRMGLVHCEQIAATPGLELVAASSHAPSLIAEARSRFGIATYESHEALLEDGDIDWVVISTRTETHSEIAMTALRAGKNLIVEKPIALRLSECETILNEAEKRSLHVVVHHNRRWDPDFQLVRRVLSESLLGQVYRIESRYAGHDSGWGAWGAEGTRNPWRLKRAHGGGMLNDWGPHLLDQLLLIFDDEVQSVFARTESRVWTSEVDDHFWAEILFSDGRSARIEASNNHRIELPRWYLLGTEGSFTVSGGGPLSWNSALLRRSFGSYPEEIHFDITHPELSSGFYEALSRAAHDGTSMPVTHDEELRLMRLIDLIRRSAKEARSVAPRC